MMIGTTKIIAMRVISRTGKSVQPPNYWSEEHYKSGIRMEAFLEIIEMGSTGIILMKTCDTLEAV